MSGSTTFGAVRLEISEEKIRVHYGPMKGWEDFKSADECLAALARWSDDEISRLSKELAGLAKLKRYIRRRTTR